MARVNDMAERLLTSREIAERLHVDVRQVYRFGNLGILPRRRYGKNYVTTETELQWFIDLTAGADLCSDADVRTFKAFHQHEIDRFMKRFKLPAGLRA